MAWVTVLFQRTVTFYNGYSLRRCVVWYMGTCLLCYKDSHLKRLYTYLLYYIAVHPRRLYFSTTLQSITSQTVKITVASGWFVCTSVLSIMFCVHIMLCDVLLECIIFSSEYEHYIFIFLCELPFWVMKLFYMHKYDNCHWIVLNQNFNAVHENMNCN